MTDKRTSSETIDETHAVSPRRIAVAATSDRGLEATLCDHFGGAPYFSVVDLHPDGRIELVDSAPNPFAEAHQPGKVPSLVRRLGAEVVIAGGMGQRAQRVFESLEIEVRGAPRASQVAEIVAAYARDELAKDAPCEHHDHHHDETR
jgi:predicted Fe-Mo cluster-binding NifX family protein